MNVKKAVLRIAVPAVGASILAAAVGVGTASASTTAPWVRDGSQGLGAQCVQAGLNYADNAGLSVDGIDGIRKNQTMITPCIVKSLLYVSALTRSPAGVMSSIRIIAAAMAAMVK